MYDDYCDVYGNMYDWLFTTVTEDVKRHFPDTEEAERMAEFFSEEIHCSLCNYGKLPTQEEVTHDFRVFY